jgi:hypothetical protein
MRDKHAKGDIPLFREKLEAYKQEFTKQTLVVSEEVYIMLKSNLNCSLKEFIQVKVYETLQAYMQDLTHTQGESTHMFQQVQTGKSKIEK